MENKNDTDHWYLLYVKEDLTAELIQSDYLRGLGNYATSEYLLERFGEDSSIISIGQAGEQLFRGAGIAVTGD